MEKKHCENGLCIKFRSQEKITVGTRAGKPHTITVQPYEYIDIDVISGRFFVKNRFTGGKMKLISGDTDEHFMQLSRIKSFIEKAKHTAGVEIWSNK